MTTKKLYTAEMQQAARSASATARGSEFWKAVGERLKQIAPESKINKRDIKDTK